MKHQTAERQEAAAHLGSLEREGDRRQLWSVDPEPSWGSSAC